VWADGGSGVGVHAEGSQANLLLGPNSTAGAPTSGAHGLGEIYCDSKGTFYKCTIAGTPGTWVPMNNPVTIATPVRAYDSRTAAAGILKSTDGFTATPRAIQITGVVAGVPANAVGVFGNLAVTQEAGVGFATIWPSGAWPGTANINFTTADISNSFTVGLSGTGTISIAASAQTHVVIDIAGFIA
jgi:hypothetical protein